jgi:hypothetical protein
MDDVRMLRTDVCVFSGAIHHEFLDIFCGVDFLRALLGSVPDLMVH